MTGLCLAKDRTTEGDEVREHEDGEAAPKEW